jgi:pyruvate/2-oxoglutarate dehydrogenase complex dihydrolipoamide dehydrogenase (E3) component
MKYDYDLIILGAGAAGLVAATAGAYLTAKTTLIEKNRLGGDCTWYGCIPSKALLKAAGAYFFIQRLRDFGITNSEEAKCEPAKVMDYVRNKVQRISTHHPVELLQRRGIEVLFGTPRFLDNKTIKLNGKKITAKRFIISTGSRPLIPQIKGLKDIDYLTNENIFDLKTLPKSLAILGAGPIGIEMAQAFRRLGLEVSVIEMMERILFREDKETAEFLGKILSKEGVKLYTGYRAISFSKEKDSVVITLEGKDKRLSVIKAEKILIAVGRVPNLEGLDLEKAGVKYSSKAIEADSTLRTTAKNIYVAGDVVGPYQFSHMAEYQAIIAVGNALFPFKRRLNYESVAWCTFTDPELAHLGLTEEEARAKNKNIRVFKFPYSSNDRAVTDSEENGFAKVICDKKGYILGAHIIGARAGELIHEYVIAKSAGLKIGRLSSAIHIYPTLSQIIKRTADQYYMGFLSSRWFLLCCKTMLRFLR